jgi:S-formylglutathione hydrolase FrmB
MVVQEVGNATFEKLPALKASSVSIAGFSSGAIFTNTLCDQDPKMFESCGSFAGFAPQPQIMNHKNMTMETIDAWRKKYQKQGNAPDSAFKG